MYAMESALYIEWMIIISNILVGVPTLMLAIITIREAHKTMNRVVEEEGRQRRLLIRLLNRDRGQHKGGRRR